jgi:hypothetical protein
MRRGPKPRKAKVKARSSIARKPLKSEGSRVRDVETRLAESLERAKVTGEILQEKNRALTEALEQQTASGEIWLMRSIEDIDFSAKREVDAKRVCL